MRDEIRKRIDEVRCGRVPEGYSVERAMLFPDDWGTPVRLNTVLWENKERNEGLHFGKEDVLSVSGEQGVVNQVQLLGRSYAGESVAPYHVVETDDMVYTKSPLKGNPFGIIKQNRGKPGIVSTLYAVYHCKNPITGQYLENYFSIDSFLNNYLKPIVKRGAKNDMKVNNEDVLLGRIPLPSIDEQRQINEAIVRVNHIIELKQKLVEELQRFKKTCLAKMFPRDGANVPELRFPGFTAPWEQRKFDEIAHRASEIGSSLELPRVEYEDIISGAGRLNKDISTKASTKAGIEFHDGDVLYGKLRPYLQNWLLSTFSGLAVGDFWVLQPQEVDSGFLYRLVQSRRFDEVANQSTGTKMPRADWKLVSKTEFAVPSSIDEQSKIGRYLNELDNLITLHQHELEEECRRKKALMQLLLTGLVRTNQLGQM